LIENFNARKDYMWLTLYTLLKYCKINLSKQKNPDQIGNLDFILTEKELQLLQRECKFITEDLKHKLGIRSVS
jgi:hypothetical protein